ncbi:M20 family metallopeptidase [Polyangium sorediatum]|uniref:Peptidase M20 domain-containing protein 2 n=1 Tax=Polyangium sorediatum TaxID=889274 RepID=A0ABT6NHW6_9BACT|nr:M20 family metallopeptidase [Polyangium sorediatum]MDI1427905.1 M20 family metallopeptidase [Polyangium sorediatum]
MPTMSIDRPVREAILAAAHAVTPIVRDVAARIFAHPELRFEETRAAGWICEAIEAEGVPVERGTGGLPTAFRARLGDGAGPRVAILAEYDALPEMGHACGHNLIAGGALGAFLAIARARPSFAGTIEIIGTPAEEGGGGKIRLLEAGVFEGVTAAMMFHPYDCDILAPSSLASHWLSLRFKGVPSHAAMAPWEGKSALAAALATMHLVDAQRVQLRDGTRVHGVVVEGGQAVNIIPERAVVDFAVRASSFAELSIVRALVERCARGAAIACSVEVEIEVRGGYKDLRPNLPLARRFGEHLAALGRPAREVDPVRSMGSTDMGDISHVIPSIHPLIAICDEGETMCHEHPFARHADSDRGAEAMMFAAQAMALTALDVLADAPLRAGMTSYFEGKNGR